MSVAFVQTDKTYLVALHMQTLADPERSKFNYFKFSSLTNRNKMLEPNLHLLTCPRVSKGTR